ncbi:hypothetical protein, partial [Acinetobacter geminorum]|uniref:hypothetical protein n=1 Tax=Acinetobacter geminorum TaxID=2730922 RepID=UPI003AF439F2
FWPTYNRHRAAVVCQSEDPRGEIGSAAARALGIATDDAMTLLVAAVAEGASVESVIHGYGEEPTPAFQAAVVALRAGHARNIAKFLV